MASSPNIRLGIMYNLEAKEFVIQFESHSQAATYQSKNNEARILNSDRNKVWLPIGPGTKYLRSSTKGMAVVFDSKAAAKRWKFSTILGELALFDGGEYGVYFDIEWSYQKLKDRIGEFETSLGPPRDNKQPSTRSSSSQGNRYNVYVGPQEGSSKARSAYVSD